MKGQTAGWTALRRPEIVLACRKCGKRAGRKGVRSELRSELKAAGHRRTRVVETGCLGLCPKAGIALATPGSLARGEVFVLGREVDAGEAVAALLGRSPEGR